MKYRFRDGVVQLGFRGTAFDPPLADAVVWLHPNRDRLTMRPNFGRDGVPLIWLHADHVSRWWTFAGMDGPWAMFLRGLHGRELLRVRHAEYESLWQRVSAESSVPLTWDWVWHADVVTE